MAHLYQRRAWVRSLLKPAFGWSPQALVHVYPLWENGELLVWTADVWGGLDGIQSKNYFLSLLNKEQYLDASVSMRYYVLEMIAITAFQTAFLKRQTKSKSQCHAVSLTLFYRICHFRDILLWWLLPAQLSWNFRFLVDKVSYVLSEGAWGLLKACQLCQNNPKRVRQIALFL